MAGDDEKRKPNPGGRPWQTDVEDMVRKGHERPVAKLISRLNTMALEAGFDRVDVARRFAAEIGGDENPRFHSRGKDGEWVPRAKEVSEHLAPRDRTRPPDRELVDVFIQLYAARIGQTSHERAELRKTLRKEIIRGLHAEAEANYQAKRQPRGTGPSAQLRKMREHNADLKGRNEELLEQNSRLDAAFREVVRKLTHTGKQLEQKEAEREALVVSHRALQQHAEVQARQLAEQDVELQQLREQVDKRDVEIAQKDSEISDLKYQILVVFDEAARIRREAAQAGRHEVVAELSTHLEAPLREHAAAGVARYSSNGGAGGASTLSATDIPVEQAEIESGDEATVRVGPKDFIGPETSGFLLVGIVVAVIVAVLGVLTSIWLFGRGFPLLVSIAPAAVVPLAAGIAMHNIGIRPWFREVVLTPTEGSFEPVLSWPVPKGENATSATLLAAAPAGRRVLDRKFLQRVYHLGGSLQVIPNRKDQHVSVDWRLSDLEDNLLAEGTLTSGHSAYLPRVQFLRGRHLEGVQLLLHNGSGATAVSWDSPSLFHRRRWYLF